MDPQSIQLADLRQSQAVEAGGSDCKYWILYVVGEARFLEKGVSGLLRSRLHAPQAERCTGTLAAVITYRPGSCTVLECLVEHRRRCSAL